MAIDDLDGKLVTVVCNLKPAKLRGIVSEVKIYSKLHGVIIHSSGANRALQAMLMAATAADGSRTEILEPPAGCVSGETN